MLRFKVLSNGYIQIVGEPEDWAKTIGSEDIHDLPVADKESYIVVQLKSLWGMRKAGGL